MSTGYVKAQIDADWNAYQQSTDGILDQNYTEYAIKWLKDKGWPDLIEKIFPKNSFSREPNYKWIEDVISIKCLSPHEKILILKMREKLMVRSAKMYASEYKYVKFAIGEREYEVGE